VGAVGDKEPRTAKSFIPEFEKSLGKVSRLSVEDFAKKLSAFFAAKWNQLMPGQKTPGQDMVFLVGGYDEGAPYGRVFEFFIPNSPIPAEKHGGPGQFGMVWGGQKEITDRLVQGFDGRAIPIAQQLLGLTDQKTEELREALRQNLNLPVPYAFLPLQDCVHLVIVLVRTTIALQQWQIGVRGVGGAIDVAVITPTEGFVEIQGKTLMGEVL
jgi:hypothetical protein